MRPGTTADDRESLPVADSRPIGLLGVTRASLLASARRRDALLGLAMFLAAVGIATVFHWPAFQEYGVFKDDVVQQPHWAAYHTTSFREDDLILRYASFNESPLQNAIYWVATWFVESVKLGKILGVVTSALG